MTERSCKMWCFSSCAQHIAVAYFGTCIICLLATYTVSLLKYTHQCIELVFGSYRHMNPMLKCLGSNPVSKQPCSSPCMPSTDHPDGPQVPLHRGDPNHCFTSVCGQRPSQSPIPAGWSAGCPEEIYLQWRGSHHVAQCLPSVQKHQRESGKRFRLSSTWHAQDTLFCSNKRASAIQNGSLHIFLLGLSHIGFCCSMVFVWAEEKLGYSDRLPDDLKWIGKYF